MIRPVAIPVRVLAFACLAFAALAPEPAAAAPRATLANLRHWQRTLKGRERLLARAVREHKAAYDRWQELVRQNAPEPIRAEAYQIVLEKKKLLDLRRAQVREAKKNVQYLKKRLSVVAIGPRSLRRVMPRLSGPQARSYARILGQAMKRFRITRPRRGAMFLAQIAHESGELRWTREIWGPTAAQRTYAWRLGNRGMGDAYRYRGGGYIQLTGRSNYISASNGTKLPLVKKPQLLNKPKYAALVSAWWWKSHGLNGVADRGDFVRVTRIINGGYNGLASRQRYYARARPVARFLVPRPRILR